MMNIVLDTNVIFGNWFLNSPNFKVVEQLVKLDVCNLVIPEIVICEVINKYKEEFAEKIQAIRRLNILLPDNKKVSHLDIDEFCKNYEAFLTKKLQDVGVEVPSHNDIPQDDIISRLFEKRKPFNETKTSDRGYRDALLWEVVLKRIIKKDDTTFFITNDVNDFAEKANSIKLHRDLIEDVKNRSLPETAICLCVNLAQWVSDYGVRYLKTAELAEDLKDGECEGFSLRFWFINERDAFIQELNEEIADILMWYKIEEPTVVYIEDPESVDVEEALMLDENTIFLKAEILAGVSVDGLIEKWQYDSETNRLPIWLMDSNWSEDYIFACLYTNLPIRFSATFNIQTKQIISFELDDIEIFGWCRHCGAVILSDAAEACYACGKDF